jgi:hypothetical protein
MSGRVVKLSEIQFTVRSRWSISACTMRACERERRGRNDESTSWSFPHMCFAARSVIYLTVLKVPVAPEAHIRL